MRLIALLLCLSIPLGALAQTVTTQPSGPISVTEGAVADEAIAQRIRDIVHELDGYGDVTVSVSAGIVTLQGTTLDTAAAGQLTRLVSRIEGIVAIENDIYETTDVVERLNPAVARFTARAQQAMAFLPLALVALAAFMLVVTLGFFIARLKKPWNKLAPNAFIADIYRQVLRLIFIVGGLVVALDIVGATALLSGILGAAGIVGLAIGFAVRDTVENFIASIMLSIRQPFRPNDTVEIEGDTGKVIRLTSRATILLSFDGNHIRIPNSTVFKSRIVNFSRNEERRFTYTLSVRSDANLDHARQLATETLNALPFVLETPKVSVWVQSVDDSSISLNMAAWINQNETGITLARSEAIRLTLAAFDEANLTASAPAYRIIQATEDPAKRTSHATGTEHLETAPQPPAPAQDVEATLNKDLDEIIDQERAEEHSDLLRDDAVQE
ncbi:mechanosensitive ion channel protein MscS [Sulfitobacter sp. SK012]|uniref:mechanosensitive ion channel family protein n=1 Tax=Sulfitobacter sp. SK012 TaxID=1389005 RepID=UPI000E0B89D9|nr:mechanosensitive ion channel family protein [Sulfitobacter sp. SK012]AXI48979.1 mechanosensitive ion channel protein MscS [Sulfitobacter sp. SK012]